MNPQLINIISAEEHISRRSVENTVKLFEEGSTIPFIARYRKEATGGLDEVQIAAINQQLKKLQEIEKRKETILSTIEEQGKLTPELRKRIENSWSAAELEDIYLPYKPKRKTRATAAREKGLEPLANVILLQQERDIHKIASKFITDDVPDTEAALQGARDIVAEVVSEDENARQRIRNLFTREAEISTKVVKTKAEEAAAYRDYFQFNEPLKRCPSHRLLAMFRGENEGFLRLSIEPEEEKAVEILERQYIKTRTEAAEQLQLAITDSYKRLIAPSIETEFRNAAKERADREAIEVFANNLKQLLLASPLGQKRILAIDPGYRTGCKVVCLDAQGNLLDNSTIFPHPPQNEAAQSIGKLQKLIKDFKIEAIAIGNGTASRETESFVQSMKLQMPVFVVSESGASIYSASDVAREEFPDKDVTVRGAISIGRRLLDPLAELVKIDPKSIGVGQYQHDVDQKMLKESLDRVVESCVNSVGVNLNTASKHLLMYVSGLGPQLAQNIVNYRAENGAFKSRTELKKVPRLGGKAFEQCAGFLRIPNAKNPLDNTAVHPESYDVVKKMAEDMQTSINELISKHDIQKQINLEKYVTAQTGLPTLKDIVNELAKPGLDPRGEAEVFSFAENITKPEQLYEGLELPGIVTNITNFGVFVDVGVKQDGLVHISQLADKFVSNPNDVVKLQQKVRVRVQEVDLVRKRISFTMKGVPQK